MTEKKTGGPAFPGKICIGHEPLSESPMYEHSKGMTLRDYFAGQALTGMFAHSSDDWHNVAKAKAMTDVAIEAYHVADLMIKERTK